MDYPPHVATLLEWLRVHGSDENRLEIRYLNQHEGHGVFAKQTLQRGQITLRVPFHLTMNVESALASELQSVVEKYPRIPDDEILALHLMYERSKKSASFFAPFIASMPTTFNLPLYWTEKELSELKGTNVLLLTQLMKQQLERDFTTIHLVVIAAFPQIFSSQPALTLEDYTWAMSVVWSRAFGITKGGKYLRILCPAMDMFNHDVRIENPLDDFISLDQETQMLTHHVPTEEAAGSALQISYGQYSNAKLLYSYGFIAKENTRRAVDFWIKLPLNDPFLQLKQTVLDSNELTKDQTYDFCGTLFTNDVDERLLATLRVILMNQEEIRLYQKAKIDQSILSIRNELAVYENLETACRRKLGNFPTTLEEDTAILAATETKSNPRLSFAVHVRMEDKQVFTGVLDTLRQWKHVLLSDPSQYPPHVTRYASDCIAFTS